MLSYETGGMTLRKKEAPAGNITNNGQYTISQQQASVQNSVGQAHSNVVSNVPRRVPGAPPKRRVPGAPPVKRDFTAQNRAHQTSNGFDSSLSQSGTSVNTVTSSSILKKTLGSMGMRQQKPKRRVPGAPSVINIHTKQVTENFSQASTPNKSTINQDRVTAQKANKYSVYTIAERNLEEYKRRQDEREGIVREKPKGWARVKKHVEWKPGFHCAVCMTVCYYTYNEPM